MKIALEAREAYLESLRRQRLRDRKADLEKARGRLETKVAENQITIEKAMQFAKAFTGRVLPPFRWEVEREENGWLTATAKVEGLFALVVKVFPESMSHCNCEIVNLKTGEASKGYYISSACPQFLGEFLVKQELV